MINCISTKSLGSFFDVSFQTDFNTFKKHVDWIIVVINVAT